MLLASYVTSHVKKYRTMDDCHNLSIFSNVQISPSKFLIWNEFGGDSEGTPLILCRNCVSSKSFRTFFSKYINILAKVWQNMVQSCISRLTLSQRVFKSVMRSTMRLTTKQRHLLKVFLLLLFLVEFYNWICKHMYLFQEAMLLLPKSPWHQLMDSGDPSYFLLITGLTGEAFNAFHDIL